MHPLLISLLIIATLATILLSVWLISTARTINMPSYTVQVVDETIDRLHKQPTEKQSAARELLLTYRSIEAMPTEQIEAWKRLNPSFTVRLFGDLECIEWLRKHAGEERARIFQQIRDGPIRADFFRCHWICQQGGVYVDLDMSPFNVESQWNNMPVADIVRMPTTKATGQLNPTVIITRVTHCTLFDMAVQVYDRLDKKGEYSYWTWSIVPITTRLAQHFPGHIDSTTLAETCRRFGRTMLWSKTCAIIEQETGTKVADVRGFL